MRKWFATLACSAVLMVGPCTGLESWNIAVNPGFGDREPFVGIDLDFGAVDFVIPLSLLGD